MNLVYSRLTSDDAAAAFKSPVTEIAFMTLPNDVGEEARAYIEQASKPINRDVVKVGKATGVATGWGESFLPMSSIASCCVWKPDVVQYSRGCGTPTFPKDTQLLSTEYLVMQVSTII